MLRFTSKAVIKVVLGYIPWLCFVVVVWILLTVKLRVRVRVGS